MTDNLRKFIRNIITENIKDLKDGNIVTRKGAEVEYGSQEHVDDLRDSLQWLLRWRDKQKTGSASRVTYSNAVNRLKSQLKAAERYGRRHGLVKET